MVGPDTPSDDDLDQLLVAQIVTHQRKVARVIATVLRDIGYDCRSALLSGFGTDDFDPMLDRCIGRLRALEAEGRIRVFGNPAKPHFSEVCLS